MIYAIDTQLAIAIAILLGVIASWPVAIHYSMVFISAMCSNNHVVIVHSSASYNSCGCVIIYDPQ